jgi:hypothetical protein
MAESSNGQSSLARTPSSSSPDLRLSLRPWPISWPSGPKSKTHRPSNDSSTEDVLFISSKGEQLKYVLQLLFKATNNSAEYEALIHDLWIAASLGIKRLLAYGDSKVVIQQVNKE